MRAVVCGVWSHLQMDTPTPPLETESWVAAVEKPVSWLVVCQPAGLVIMTGSQSACRAVAGVGKQRRSSLEAASWLKRDISQRGADVVAYPQ